MTEQLAMKVFCIILSSLALHGIHWADTLPQIKEVILAKENLWGLGILMAIIGLLL